MKRHDPARLADGLERLKERRRESLAPPEYAVLLSAIEVLRGAATGDPLKEAAAALDQEEKLALGNWGGWFEWLGEFPEQCVNFLRLRLALGRGVPEELESLAEVLRDAPETFVDPERNNRHAAPRPPPPDTDPGRDTKTGVRKPGGEP